MQKKVIIVGSGNAALSAGIASLEKGADVTIYEKADKKMSGGNTKYMLEIWKKHNLNKLFREAHDQGSILSGVSAGAVCWFDWILSDSIGSVLKPLKGINLISGKIKLYQ